MKKWQVPQFPKAAAWQDCEVALGMQTLARSHAMLRQDMTSQLNVFFDGD
jgi:hypothetical protein